MISKRCRNFIRLCFSGYYDHPRARGLDALDEYWKIKRCDLDLNFNYFGSVETNTNGVYWFQTIIPSHTESLASIEQRTFI
jgi:protocatechuate 3,4-dioxygenase beta subunit